MLFLDGVYLERPDGTLSFRWVRAPTSAELTALASRIAQRVGRFLERHGLLECDRKAPCLAELALDEEPMRGLLAHSITYRIALGPRAGRKVFTLQTLPPGDEPFGTTPGQVGGFSPTTYIGLCLKTGLHAIALALHRLGDQQAR
jgi:hypothetical protein